MGARQLVAKDHRLPFCGPCACGPTLFRASSSGVSMEAGGCAGAPTREPGAAWAGRGSLEAGLAHRGGGETSAVLGCAWQPVARHPLSQHSPSGRHGAALVSRHPVDESRVTPPSGPAAWGGGFPAEIRDWHRELIQRSLKIKGSIILIKFHLF